MNVHDTVESSLRRYPMLHQNRSMVLHFLFCVIGNGYEWVNGELMELHPDVGVEPHDLELSAMIQEILEQDPMWQRSRARNQERDRIVAASSALLADIPGPIDSMYPYSECAHLLSIPEDVTKDWLAAAHEIALDMLSNPTADRGDVSKWRKSFSDTRLFDPQ